MRQYGAWAGNRNGHPEQPTRCIVEVYNGFMFGQCGRKRGHGPDSLYCKQHAKILAAGRRLPVPNDAEPAMTPEEQIEKRRDSLTADYRNGKPFMGWTDLHNLAGLLLTRIAELTLEIEQLREKLEMHTCTGEGLPNPCECCGCRADAENKRLRDDAEQQHKKERGMILILADDLGRYTGRPVPEVERWAEVEEAKEKP